MSGTSKHPKGLYVLFFTEMWERFGYYLMLGIFSLYMLDGWENGGMGFDALKKSDIYGTYLGLVYLTPFIGGLLADRILGFRKSIISGGLLMAAGYLTLAVHDVNAFYIGLLLIIMGNGMFKPNISTLVGNLYNNDKYRDNKDAGFNIFYMGINIGAFVCNFVAAFMQINYGWGYAFAAAGIGMLIGVVVFISGNKWVKHADIIKPLEPGDMSTSKILLSTLVPMFVFGVLGYLIRQPVGHGHQRRVHLRLHTGCGLLHLPLREGERRGQAAHRRAVGGVRLFGDLLGGVPPERRCAHRMGQGLHEPGNADERLQRGGQDEHGRDRDEQRRRNRTEQFAVLRHHGTGERTCPRPKPEALFHAAVPEHQSFLGGLADADHRGLLGLYAQPEKGTKHTNQDRDRLGDHGAVRFGDGGRGDGDEQFGEQSQ